MKYKYSTILISLKRGVSALHHFKAGYGFSFKHSESILLNVK